MSFANDVIVPTINTTTGLLKMHLNDLSEADFLARPCSGANHAMWQIGHVTTVESKMAGIVSGKGSDLPDSFTKCFKKDMASVNDPAAFPTKAELISMFEHVRGQTVAIVAALKDDDLQKTAEGLPPFAPTFGQVAILFGAHTMMHIGQIQAIRRSLTKPVLF